MLLHWTNFGYYVNFGENFVSKHIEYLRFFSPTKLSSEGQIVSQDIKKMHREKKLCEIYDRRRFKLA